MLHRLLTTIPKFAGALAAGSAALLIAGQASATAFVSDLQISLSNGTTTIQLFNGAKDNASGDMSTLFDDESANAHSGSAPFPSDMQPFEALSAFDGQALSGTWTLSILDDFFSDEGDDLIFWILTGTTDGGEGFAFDGLPANDVDTDPATMVSFDIVSTASIADLNVGIIIRNDEDVPEPATLGLLGAGLIGLAVMRRRRKA